MRLNLALVVSIIVAVGIVALGFTFYQISAERSKLTVELESRTKQIAEDILQDDNKLLLRVNQDNIEGFVDSLIQRYNLLGFAIYANNDSIIANYASRPLISQSMDYISQAIVADTAQGNFITLSGEKIFQYIVPDKLADTYNTVFIFYTDATYIDHLIDSIWLRNFIRWFAQALLISLITVLIIRWGILGPINRIVDWIRAARIGNVEHLKIQPPAKFLVPLHAEVMNIAQAMREANALAEVEARLRTSAEAIWTAERLKLEMERILQDKKMVVVSNREPYMHIHEGRKIKCIVPASGMITAMEPILTACGGLWIASGSGDADKVTVDENDKVLVPPEDPKYTLKRIWLSQEDETHFYYGFSNEGLWPLCHIAHTRPTFRKEDWSSYKKVNEDFARAVLEETTDEEQPFILIQDYHFALLPELIKKEKPNAKVAIFWHIPWPNPESFGICPWQREILRGMLGADLIGFHTQYHCNHFLETVNKALESRVLWENFSVKMGGHTTFVKPFPISIAFNLTGEGDHADLPHIHPEINGVESNVDQMGIGVDRIDYTKGIIEKFLAIERFLEKNSAYIGKFTFVQIGAPSRTFIRNYSDMVTAVQNEAARINLRFKHKNWVAIRLLIRHHSHDEIHPYYSKADFCMVTSLHDGMNLVAKEFIASRDRNDGVLILSRFAGASEELSSAIIINPYDIEQAADAIKLALEMTKEEQHQRMEQMRRMIAGHNIYLWASNLLKTMAAIQN